jgi:hypothetical protein
MNKFERWFLKRIIAREVTQGFSHVDRITDLYRMIRVACEHEFYEDNLPTMNANLTYWFEDSLRKPSK